MEGRNAEIVVVLGLGFVGVDVREEDEHDHGDEGNCGKNREEHLELSFARRFKHCWMQRGRRDGLTHTPTCRDIP